MALRVRPVRDPDELRRAIGAIGHYFGWQPGEDDAARFGALMPLERMLAVTDDGEIVAGAGAYPLELTLPGGRVPCAGVTVVGVLPSHRRRGLLTRMMRAQLEDIRERGEPVAVLWASEETIYGRFGYGLASMMLWLDVERHHASIHRELPAEGSFRLVDDAEALRAFPRVYDRARKTTAGLTSRLPAWWEHRILGDRPEQRRGAGNLTRVLHTRDGRDVGYVLYRIAIEGSTPEDWKKTVRVKELVALDDAAGRDLWRYLLSIDWTERVQADVAVDDPVLLTVDRVNKLNARLFDGLWARVVDVPGALAARGVRDPVVVEVASDPLFPDNVGAWRVGDGDVRRVSRAADVVTDIQGLATVILGGFGFADLARAGRATENRRGGLARVDDAFRTDRSPYCPEIF